MNTNQIARTSRGGPSLCLAITTGDAAATVAGRWSGRGFWSSLMTGSYAPTRPEPVWAAVSGTNADVSAVTG
jgi:hypothetical protein